MMSQLSLVDELSGPPLSSSSRSRDESGTLWEDAGHKLRDSIGLLWKSQFACFALLSTPVPLSGPFWDDVFTARAERFYVLCGSVKDDGLRKVIRAFDLDGPDYLT